MSAGPWMFLCSAVALAVTVMSAVAQEAETSLTMRSASKSFDRMRTEPLPSIPQSAKAVLQARSAARLTAPAAKVLVIFIVVPLCWHSLRSGFVLRIDQKR